MEDLSDCFAEIIEFQPHCKETVSSQYLETSTGTDPLPLAVDKWTTTIEKSDVQTQTHTTLVGSAICDDRKLGMWLKKIYPFVESELLKGITPIQVNSIRRANDEEEIKIQTYQKISFPYKENCLGVCTWLSIYTNNMPILVLTTCVSHDDWCEHIDHTLRIFVPQRLQSSKFVAFHELKSIQTKACISTLSTNPFDKDLFVGSTVSGDLYIWRFISNKNQGDVHELFCETMKYGAVADFAWPNAAKMLSAHANGKVCLWRIGPQILNEKDFLIKDKHNLVAGLKKIVSVSAADFIVGCTNGALYHCINAGVGEGDFHIKELRRHNFAVTSLFKKNVRGRKFIISCDLSGEVFFHDIVCNDEESPKVILRIPLPFQNNIACSSDGEIIFCPGMDGALDIYRVKTGKHTTVKGALRGRGTLIQMSDNNSWIVTGFYEGDFQIFRIKNE